MADDHTDIDFIRIEDLLADESADAKPKRRPARSPAQMPLLQGPDASKNRAGARKQPPPAPLASPEPTTALKTPPITQPPRAAIVLNRRVRGRNESTVAAATGVMLILLAVGLYLYFSPQPPAPEPVAQAHKTFDVPRPAAPAATLQSEPSASPKPPLEESIQPVAPAAPAAPEAPAASVSAVDLEQSVGDFLAAWQTSWEHSAGPEGKIEDHLNCYAQDFTTAGMDKAAWGADKGLKNRRKDWIRVRLSDVRITPAEVGDTVSVTFLQDYASSNYSEISEKTLLLNKNGSSWQIIGIQ